MRFTYETNRLILKVLDSEYAQAVNEFLKKNRCYFEPFETSKPTDFYTVPYQIACLDAEYTAFIKLKYIRYYAFLKNEPGKIIGTVSFSNILPDPYCSCSIGYKIDHDYQNQGYGKELVNAAAKAMFSDFGIHRIAAYVLNSNKASINLLTSLNFMNEGICQKSIKICGTYQDHLRFSLISPFSK